jgi:hypothetical protein
MVITPGLAGRSTEVDATLWGEAMAVTGPHTATSSIAAAEVAKAARPLTCVTVTIFV